MAPNGATSGDEIQEPGGGLPDRRRHLRIGARRGVSVHLPAWVRRPRRHAASAVRPFPVGHPPHARALPLHRRPRRGHARIHLPPRERRGGSRRERQLDRPRRHGPLRLWPLGRLRGGQLADREHRGGCAGPSARQPSRPARGGRSRTLRVARRFALQGSLGGPEIKCDVDTQFHFAGRAVAVWVGQGRPLRPAAWMSLDGRRQSRPDRNTRGYFTRTASGLAGRVRAAHG